MLGRGTRRRTRRSWGKWAVLLAGLTVAILVFSWCRSTSLPRATAQQPPSSPPVPQATTTPATSSDYANRVVAYLYNTTPITRQELGDYLIARQGADKLPLLVNRRIIDDACRGQHIDVTPVEVEAEMVEALKGVPGNRREFLNQLLKERHLTFYEWKEDVLRPKLLMTKYCRSRVSVSDEEVQKAFEACYGDKVECLMIRWPESEQAKAHEVYGLVRNNAEEFDRQARQQKDTDLAASGGRLKPFGRYSTGNEALEKAAFSLQPGEVSPLLGWGKDVVILKCLRHLPADTTKKLEDVRAFLQREIIERKLQVDIATVFSELRTKANPQLLLPEPEAPASGVASAPRAPVVATLYGNTPIMREELGEFLIARYGAGKLELLVNKRIIDRACQARGIQVGEADIDAVQKDTLEALNLDLDKFKKQLLREHHMSLYEWRQDVIRPKLLMTKLSRDRVRVTEDDLKQGFEAYYGEKIECRLIMWPKNEKHIAEKLYPQIRNSDEEFIRIAKQQPSGRLSGNAGYIGEIGRHTTGNPELEREVFSLREGEISSIIGTPEGFVVVKCLKRIPPNTTKKLDDVVRAGLEKEIMEKKVQQEIPVVFQELRKEANANLLLKRVTTDEELKRSVLEEIGGTP